MNFRSIRTIGSLLLAASLSQAQFMPAPAVQNFAMAEFQAPNRAGGSGGESDDSRYNSALDDINAHRYEQALANFNLVVAHGGTHAEGGLYWKAYVLHKLGRGAEAQAAIDTLRKSYPKSRWMEDAKALELEIRQSKGPVSPGAESDEDLKILTLNKLMQSDPERALPQVESLLKTSHSPNVKRQALTVIAMNGSARARQDLEQIARSGNPDLQLAAVRYLSRLPYDSGTHQIFSEIYAASNDRGVKLAIIAALRSAKDKQHLLQIAKVEKGLDLPGQAILALAAAGGQAELWEVYQSQTTSEGKQFVLNAMEGNGSLDKLTGVARSDKDRNVRLTAIRAIAAQKTPDARAALGSLYGIERDEQVKQVLLNALHESGKALAENENTGRGGRPGAAQSPKLLTADGKTAATLDVIALDSEGRPVTDLREGDFQVIDDGKVRPITSFHASESEPPGRPAATVVLFDLLNFRAQIQDPSWGLMARALESRESGDRLYLYLLSNNGDLFPIHEVPASDAQDEAADPHWNRQAGALLDDAARKLVGLKARDMSDLRVSIPTTYQTIENLGLRLAALPGRKNLIWVSSGMPIQIHAQGTNSVDEWTDLTPFLWRLSASLDRAHIAVYTVGQQPRGDSAPLNSVNKETLQLISAVTGGRYYPSDLIDKAISQAVMDAHTRYVIDYEPAPWKLDNKYHKIRVTCARKGVVIHSKQGYYGIPSRPSVGSGRSNTRGLLKNGGRHPSVRGPRL